MQVHGYTHEDYDKDTDAAMALATALKLILSKMKRYGLENCTEFDRGKTALDHWLHRQNENIKKVEDLLNRHACNK